MANAYIRYAATPVDQSLTVCFEISRDCESNHASLMTLLKARLVRVRDARVTSLLFVARDVIGGSAGHGDRWLVTVGCEAAMDELLRGLQYGGRAVVVRRYAAVLSEERRRCERLKGLTEDMRRLFSAVDPQTDVSLVQ